MPRRESPSRKLPPELSPFCTPNVISQIARGEALEAAQRRRPQRAGPSGLGASLRHAYGQPAPANQRSSRRNELNQRWVRPPVLSRREGIGPPVLRLGRWCPLAAGPSSRPLNTAKVASAPSSNSVGARSLFSQHRGVALPCGRCRGYVLSGERKLALAERADSRALRTAPAWPSISYDIYATKALPKD